MKINRTTPPAIIIPDNLSMPASRLITADNGIDLHILNSGDLHVIRLSLVFRAGTAYQKYPFSASAALTLLNEGTLKYNSAEIAEKLDFYGSYYDANIDRDYSVVTICSLSKFFKPTLELLEDIVINPTYPEHEFKTYVDKRKQALAIDRGKVAFRAREMFASALFGEKHPYGIYSAADKYDLLRISHLKEFHSAHYGAGNCFAVSSGLIDDDNAAAISRFLSKIPVLASIPQEKLPAVEKTSYVYSEQKDAVQSAIRVGRRMFPRNHPDYIGMQVLCTVLGGYFGSRLIANLREDKGYTYGVFAAMVNLENEGYMAIATEVGVQFTEAAVEEIFFEIECLKNELIDQEELAIVKNMIIGELMRILDGPFGIADIMIENIQNGTDNSYLPRFIEEINRITPVDLQQLAQKYFIRDEFVTVIVGKK